jgi:DNA-binding transcriptional MerR regulator
LRRTRHLRWLLPTASPCADVCLDLALRYRVHAGRVRTSEVAEQTQVNPQTWRYYERRGLLPEPARSASGYRAYTVEAVQVVRFIKRAQDLGFALADVEILLHLAEGGPESCEAVHSLATEKIADLDARIVALQAMRGALGRLVETCNQPRTQRECPILNEITSTDRAR